MWWYKQIYSIILVFLVFVTVIKGSCLEYGHSCWGAHGKRSGTGSGKIYRAGSELRTGDLNVLPANDANKLFEDFNELSAPAESSAHADSAEESSADATNASKLKNLLRKRKSKYRNRNSLDDSSEPQERNDMQHAEERWQALPVFNLKRFDKSSLSAGELLGRLERQAAASRSAARLADEGNYYDLN